MSQLLTQILSKENMMTAFTKVCANKGSAGVDGITVTDIGMYLHKNWRMIKSQILARKSKPQPVLRVMAFVQTVLVKRLSSNCWSISMMAILG